MQISMTEDGNPLDNSIAERVNGILKEEYIDIMLLQENIEIEQAVEQAVYIYNQLRLHLGCDIMTPNQAHIATGQLKKRWKNYYKLKLELN